MLDLLFDNGHLNLSSLAWLFSGLWFRRNCNTRCLGQLPFSTSMCLSVGHPVLRVVTSVFLCKWICKYPCFSAFVLSLIIWLGYDRLSINIGIASRHLFQPILKMHYFSLYCFWFSLIKEFVVSSHPCFPRILVICEFPFPDSIYESVSYFTFCSSLEPTDASRSKLLASLPRWTIIYILL